MLTLSLQLASKRRGGRRKEAKQQLPRLLSSPPPPPPPLLLLQWVRVTQRATEQVQVQGSITHAQNEHAPARGQGKLPNDDDSPTRVRVPALPCPAVYIIFTPSMASHHPQHHPHIHHPTSPHLTPPRLPSSTTKQTKPKPKPSVPTMCPGLRNAMPPSACATHDHPHHPSSYLLELAAADDLPAFRRAVQEDNLSLVAASPWYGPSPKTAKTRTTQQLALHLRTPAMVAALYGSTTVLSYVLSIAPSEAARASASDGATPLLLAHAGRAPSAPHAARLLLSAGASSSDLLALDHHLQTRLPASPTKRDTDTAVTTTRKTTTKKVKDYSSAAHSDLAQAEDINAGVFATDDFRMYSFKVNPCSRAYTHDWTECPFAHPGENARRRDPRRVPYSCVPCPDFRRDPQACRKGDACEYAHGVFESWLHPAQYRTRLCKDEVGCPRRICFFAHGTRQLRAVNPSAASMASPSPTSSSSSPPRSSSTTTRPALTASLSSRELDLDADSQNQYARRMMMARANSPPDYSPDLVAAYVQALSSLQHQQQQQQQQHQQQQQQHQQQSSARIGTKPPMGGLSARAAAFANRSQTFVHRSPSPAPSLAPARSFKSPAPSSMLADWGSPDGKLEWGVQGAELRKSTSFGVRSSSRTHDARRQEDMYSSWLKDGGSDMLAARWSDLEQMVA